MQDAILSWVNERALNKDRISLGAGNVVQSNKEGREVERQSTISPVTARLHLREYSALEDTGLIKAKYKGMRVCVSECCCACEKKREEAHCYTEGKDAAGETLGISVLEEYSSWTNKKRKKGREGIGKTGI